MLKSIKGMEMLTECKAWQDFLSGDNDAYSVIYNTYIGELYTYAMCFTKDRTLAEDAIHDVFVKIYSERDKLHHVKSIRQYLYSSVRNRILNLLRKAEMSENFNELDGLDIIGDSLVEKQYETKEKNVKTTVLASLFAAAAVALSACSSVPDLISVNAMKIDGKDIYLRGEMNDYAAISSNRLIKRDEGMYCTLAALRSDWTPYRFKFADDNWSQGSNFGYAYPPGVMRAGSAPMKLNPNSQFEELRYFPKEDAVYQFCIVQNGNEYFATVEKASDKEVGFFNDFFRRLEEL